LLCAEQRHTRWLAGLISGERARELLAAELARLG
jgi:hypothetical protein